jgi:hypothetical protein
MSATFWYEIYFVIFNTVSLLLLLFRGRYRKNAPHTLRPLPIYFFLPIWVLIISYSLTRTLGNILQCRLQAKQEEFGQKCPWILLISFSFIPQGLLTCRKILQHWTDDFTSSPKKFVLRIFIALKNPSSSAGFEPMNLGSNGTHNYY